MEAELYTFTTERNAAMALVEACLRRGWSLSLDNGEYVSITRSRNPDDFEPELNATEIETLIAYNDGARVGAFLLVWGNSPEELCADYTDNPACDAVWQEVFGENGF